MPNVTSMMNQIAESSSPLSSLSPRGALAHALLALLLPGCIFVDDDDDDDVRTPVDVGRPTRGGDTDAGDRGGMRPDADAGVDRYVFRPREIAPTPELIAGLTVPPGFGVNVFASDIGHARMLASHAGSIYVTRPMTGDVLRLTDADEDGVAEEQLTATAGLPYVHGIAFRGSDVYLATDDQVLRASVDATGAFGIPSVVLDDLPDGGQHPYRTLGIGPDGQLYVSVGSSCDACAESNPEHATMLTSTLDGANRRVLARGLRNTIGFGWHPETGELWGMDHGADWRGNDLPPEELNRLTSGADYGWPYCFGDRQIDPVIDDPPGETKAAYCARTTPATLVTRAHNAPIGFVFYTGSAFPSEYQGDAFVAMRGSWNAFPPTGYEIVRLVYEDGAPIRFEDFVTGFLNETGDTTFARPAGITVGADGSLLFSDDVNGYVYRVSRSDVPADAGAADAGTDAGD